MGAHLVRKRLRRAGSRLGGMKREDQEVDSRRGGGADGGDTVGEADVDGVEVTEERRANHAASGAD